MAEIQTTDWRVGESSKMDRLLISAEFEGRSLVIAAVAVNAPDAEAMARLMAAAPDLLSALQRLVAEGSWSPNDPQTQQARAAIAKAEGK